MAFPEPQPISQPPRSYNAIVTICFENHARVISTQGNPGHWAWNVTFLHENMRLNEVNIPMNDLDLSNETLRDTSPMMLF